MAVVKPMEPFDLEVEGNPDAAALEVDVVNPEAVSITTEDDGTLVIDFTGEMTEELMGPEHNSNYAEFIDDAGGSERDVIAVADVDARTTERFGRRTATHRISSFENDHRQSTASEVIGGHEAVVTGSDDDDIARRREIAHVPPSLSCRQGWRSSVEACLVTSRIFVARKSPRR